MLKVCYVLQMHMARTTGHGLPVLALLQWLGLILLGSKARNVV
jgi:hypothetical protein